MLYIAFNTTPAVSGSSATSPQPYFLSQCMQCLSLTFSYRNTTLLCSTTFSVLFYALSTKNSQQNDTYIFHGTDGYYMRFRGHSEKGFRPSVIQCAHSLCTSRSIAIYSKNMTQAVQLGLDFRECFLWAVSLAVQK